MKKIKNAANHSTKKDISERPIIPCTKTMLSKKDKLKMRKTKASHNDFDLSVKEGLEDYYKYA